MKKIVFSAKLIFLALGLCFLLTWPSSAQFFETEGCSGGCSMSGSGSVYCSSNNTCGCWNPPGGSGLGDCKAP